MNNFYSPEFSYSLLTFMVTSFLLDRKTFLQEMYSLADRIGLRVPDIDTFLENLNTAGYLLKKGPKTYQVYSSTYLRTRTVHEQAKDG